MIESARAFFKPVANPTGRSACQFTRLNSQPVEELSAPEHGGPRQKQNQRLDDKTKGKEGGWILDPECDVTQQGRAWVVDIAQRPRQYGDRREKNDPFLQME